MCPPIYIYLISPPVYIYNIYSHILPLNFLGKVFIFEGAMPEKALKYAQFQKC